MERKNNFIMLLVNKSEGFRLNTDNNVFNVRINWEVIAVEVI